MNLSFLYWSRCFVSYFVFCCQFIECSIKFSELLASDGEARAIFLLS